MTGTNTFSAADLVAVIPEVWGTKVLEAYFAKTVAANFFLDLSDLAPEGDTLHVPDLFTNSMASAAKSNGSEVTLNSPTQTDTTIAMSTWRHVAYLVEDKELKQAARIYAVLDMYARQAGDTLADDLEDTLLGLWSGLSTTAGTTSAAVTDLQIRQCVRRLDVNNVPNADRGWFFHPINYWDQIAAAAKFYDASQYGGPTFARTGNFGEVFDFNRGFRGVLYGDPVFISTNVVSNLTAYRNIYAHKDAFGYVVQTPGEAHIRMQSEYVLENLGVLTVCDIIYGAGELRDSSAVVLNGSTSASTA